MVGLISMLTKLSINYLHTLKKERIENYLIEHIVVKSPKSIKKTKWSNFSLCRSYHFNDWSNHKNVWSNHKKKKTIRISSVYKQMLYNIIFNC